MKSETFLKLDGVEGDSTDVHHRGWFDVTAVSVQGVAPDPSRMVVTGRRSYKPIQIAVSIGPKFANITNLIQNSKVLGGGEIVYVTNGIATKREVLSHIAIQSYSKTGGTGGGNNSPLTASLNVICGVQEEALTSVASATTIPGRSAVARNV